MQVRVTLTSGSLTALLRLVLRLLAIIFSAALWPNQPMASGLARLSFIMAAVCVLTAVAHRESLRQSRLNRWDEAAALVLIGLLVRLSA